MFTGQNQVFLNSFAVPWAHFLGHPFAGNSHAPCNMPFACKRPPPKASKMQFLDTCMMECTSNFWKTGANSKTFIYINAECNNTLVHA